MADGLWHRPLLSKTPHPRSRDISSVQVESLTAERYLGGDGRDSIWAIRCACGKLFGMAQSEFCKGRQKSCGCLRGALIAKANTTHGMSKHPAFAVWSSMLARCLNPKHPAWKNYGGRGITVCSQWQTSFERFWRDTFVFYAPRLELDREDNDLGYSRANCRWVTRKTNDRNKRTNVLIDTPDGRMTLAEASERTGIGATTLQYRNSHGFSTSRMLAPTVGSPSSPKTDE